MKRAILGVAAIGVIIIALRPAAGRVGQKMREHCEQMASTCKQMMATPPGERCEAAMPEHCKEMMAAHEHHHQAAEPSEPFQQDAPRSAGREEAIRSLTVARRALPIQFEIRSAWLTAAQHRLWIQQLPIRCLDTELPQIAPSNREAAADARCRSYP